MRRGPIPLYYQILQIIRGRVAAGDYPAGKPLPTDEALMREFGVSRHTVRAALQQLVAEGLIERFPGRGSFARPRPAGAGPWSIESVEDLIDTSFIHKYRIIAARFVPARTFPRVAELYRLGPRDSLFHVRAVRSSKEGPYAYSNVYFPRDIGEKLPRGLFTQRPLILLVEEHCSLPPFQTRQVASAAPADREAARLLKVRFGEALLVLERTYFSRDGRAIEHTRIQYRPDRYQQVVHFARRQDAPYAPSREAETQRLRGGHDGAPR